jgi:putative transposase
MKSKRPIPPGHTQLGHRIELDPTGPQVRLIRQWCGVARFCYNAGLEFRTGRYRGEKLSTKEHEVRAHLRDLRDNHGKDWIGQAPKEVLEGASRDLDRAMGNFFKGLKGKGAGQRYPARKRRGQHDSYYVRNENLKFNGLLVTLPKLGRVRMKELLRLSGRVMSARVSIDPTGRTFLSLQVLGPHLEERAAKEKKRRDLLASQGIPVERAPVVGLDVGISRELVTSEGEIIMAPRPLRVLAKRIARAQRVMARRQKGSKNRTKARVRVAGLNARATNIRKDHLNKLTTRICRENQTIVCEDLNIKGMKQLRILAPALQDIAPATLLQQLAYKAPLFGCRLVVASRWFPSTKRCSACGTVKDQMGLGERIYKCCSCGAVLDRDLNAALNLAQYPELISQYPPAGGEVTPGERMALLDRLDLATNLVEPGISDSHGLP